MNLLKLLNITGLSFSTFGSILVGFISQKGIPKKGEPIRAPKYRVAIAGWILIIFGFILSLIAAIFNT